VRPEQAAGGQVGQPHADLRAAAAQGQDDGPGSAARRSPRHQTPPGRPSCGCRGARRRAARATTWRADRAAVSRGQPDVGDDEHAAGVERHLAQARVHAPAQPRRRSGSGPHGRRRGGSGAAVAREPPVRQRRRVPWRAGRRPDRGRAPPPSLRAVRAMRRTARWSSVSRSAPSHSDPSPELSHSRRADPWTIDRDVIDAAGAALNYLLSGRAVDYRRVTFDRSAYGDCPALYLAPRGASVAEDPAMREDARHDAGANDTGTRHPYGPTNRHPRRRPRRP
jgi:hypothetical protein